MYCELLEKTNSPDDNFGSEEEISLNKNDQIEKELDQIYLAFFEPKADSEIKENLIYKLKKYLETSQGSVYNIFNFHSY